MPESDVEFCIEIEEQGKEPRTEGYITILKSI
jgi:hypothetical protein